MRLSNLACAMCLSSAGLIAGFIGGCSGSTSAKPPPPVSLGNSSTATATYPNPCEIDLDFGTLPVGAATTATVKIENTTPAQIDLSELEPTLDPAFGLNGDTSGTANAESFVQIQVTFQPYKTGQVTSSFTVQTGGTDSACPDPALATVVLTGSAIQLSLVVQPSTLDFGSTLTNTTSKNSVTLVNKSNAPVDNITTTISGSDANLFTVDDAPTSLAANAEATVDISYAPLGGETRSQATLTFSSGDGEKGTVSLFGEPVGVGLTLAPNPIDFGYVPPSSTAIGCTTVSNQGNVAVTIKSITSFATSGNAFNLASADDATPANPLALPITLQGGDSAKVCFAFTPPLIQQYQGQATLVTDDPSGTNPIVQLTGWGGGPQIACSPAAVDFGETIEDGLAIATVVCTNTGTAISGVNLTIDPPTASPAVFTASFDGIEGRYPLGGLAPGQTVQIDLSYAPTAASNDNGTLFIKSNGGRGETIELPLSGQGLDVPACQFVVAPSALDFANLQLGAPPTDLTFEIQNVGSNICLVQVRITDDVTDSFHILSLSIPPDPVTGTIVIPSPATGVVSNLTISVEFIPTGPDLTLGAELSFTISDPGAPNQVVQLTGTSLATDGG